jgi:hypothetical protein
MTAKTETTYDVKITYRWDDEFGVNIYGQTVRDQSDPNRVVQTFLDVYGKGAVVALLLSVEVTEHVR